MTPSGRHHLIDRTHALARARHETANRRFKCFGVLSQIYRHELELHGRVFRAVANIVQVTIKYNLNPLFSIEYEEADFFS